MPSIEVVLCMDAARFPRTSDLLQTFNNVVCQVASRRRFISLFYGTLCPQSNSLEYTNAGHNPPLLIRAGRESSPLDKEAQYWACFPTALADDLTLVLLKKL
jgi:sigma-B regulation protein RsbU (phosphoserine phosphatase)